MVEAEAEGGGGGGCTPPNTCAAWTPESGFSIGSYLLSINTQQSAVLNVLLSKLGTSANVTILGYQGLANTYVSIGQLITASGGLLTTSNVMTTSLTGAQWLAIWQNAVANQVAASNCTNLPLACNAQTALSGLSFSASNSTTLGQMVSIGGSNCSNNGTLTTSALTANLNVLQELTTEAELANGSSALNVTSALSLTVAGLTISSSNLYLTLIQPPQIACPGPVGSYVLSGQCPAPSGQTSTCATTAQLSSDLKLSILGLGVLDIPLSAATGIATLNQINCTNNVMTSVKLNVGTNLVTGAVTLAGVGVATLNIAAVVGRIGTYTTVPPTYATEFPSSGPPTNPQNFGSTTPTFSYVGLSPLSPVKTLLNSTLPPVLGPVLQAAGVQVGGAQVADTSARCDVVSIVG